MCKQVDSVNFGGSLFAIGEIPASTVPCCDLNSFDKQIVLTGIESPPSVLVMVDKVFSFSIRKFALSKANQFLDYVEVQFVPEDDPQPSSSATPATFGDAPHPQVEPTDETDSPQTVAPSLTLSPPDSDSNLSPRPCRKTNQRSQKLPIKSAKELPRCKAKLKAYVARRPNSIVGITTTKSSDEAEDSDNESVCSNYSSVSCPGKT